MRIISGWPWFVMVLAAGLAGGATMEETVAKFGQHAVDVLEKFVLMASVCKAFGSTVVYGADYLREIQREYTILANWGMLADEPFVEYATPVMTKAYALLLDRPECNGILRTQVKTYLRSPYKMRTLYYRDLLVSALTEDDTGRQVWEDPPAGCIIA